MNPAEATGLSAVGAGSDPMPVSGIDHLELYVGNAAQTAFFLEHALGFTEVAYAGLETGSRERVSRVLQQGRIRLVVTGTLGRGNAISRFHARHGDSVRTIALGVPDARSGYEQAIARGAQGHDEPCWIEDEHGRAQLASVAAYGDVVHTFVQRDAYQGPFLPGFARRGVREAPAPGLFAGIDHVVGNVELGRMDEWVRFYETVFGMTEMIHLTDADISTEYSALMSKVLTDGSGRIKFPINEPAEGERKSQIQEFLDFHDGPGVQHVALTTTDIVGCVADLGRRRVEFLPVPETYYDELPDRIGDIEEDLRDLRALGILVDRDDEGYLMQIFTKPLGDRPTLFLEIIERHGARGFGQGNFKALFEAIECEQDRRGNL